ncbi:MAG: hypothetical protein UU54_C0004G0013 [Candidatus Yanofskybacteria bacterium GW2011_GWA2_41_22]|uniref:Uncharacterized protein n=4 Tax=Parcubacteria group TaxID=1794811 RepID=A0A1F8HWA3_9BACT|nr:MAG: hypothetical protein UU54_C0004G0013 [Candidatus Yanofskybacteria bacterium GW2011_GWA2_41_22]KKS25763.1 MAG: hypothetical protein UU83_C0002G0011 [Candidatus Jorgensenbacteria bacterium GW2011_GWF2_41_8]KKS27658.1 MAG: hypothetical protein UU84_C0002G0011 [Candidatus Yanofskybacteria bacterium GW2011_GWC2_41_9]KKT16204.1 MAG: hypothetical protein UV98_C0036G0003 [Parcubacteria group bacterium GW2011_GWB1_43_6]OGN08767.1 MAG: hypothetical protein A3C64_02045 [Candidatus Yanofskybacteria
MDNELEQYLSFSPYFAGMNTESSDIRSGFIEQFSKLPLPIKQLLTSTSTTQIMFSIGQENGLEDVTTEYLAKMIRHVLMGEIFIKDLPNLLVSALNLSPDQATAINKRVLNELFVPITNDLKKIQQAKFPDRLSASPIVPSQNQSVPSQAPRLSTTIPNTNQNNTVDLRNK